MVLCPLYSALKILLCKLSEKQIQKFLHVYYNYFRHFNAILMFSHNSKFVKEKKCVIITFSFDFMLDIVFVM